jgi:ketosteroid isomerase-like protein
VSDEDEVRAANQSFYDAHEARDLDAMAALWGDGAGVACTHPGWPILRGREYVLESWARIFDGPGRNQFILTNDVVTVVGDAGWVTLDENLVDRGETGAIAATNVFHRVDGAWRLLVHHGSPVLT